MTILTDTTSGEISDALSAERRRAGALAFGVVLTLVVVVEPDRMDKAVAVATEASAAHPCRVIAVAVTSTDGESSIDADIHVGGMDGPGEVLALTLCGPVAGRPETVVLPLLAPDTPVVTWWYGEPPDSPATDPLGALAVRRVTDSFRTEDPIATLITLARAYQPGDTDLAWTRCTQWRSALAASLDPIEDRPSRGRVDGETGNASAALLAAWLRVRLGVDVALGTDGGPGISGVELEFPGHGNDGELRLTRPQGTLATLARPGQPDRILPIPRRELVDLLAEELRRLGADEPYGEILVGLS